MAKFFIARPVFALVVALVIVLVGLAAIPGLPIATYPEVVPPVVQIVASLRGGNSRDIEQTVAQPIEQQLVGLDGMLYFFSRCSNDGTLTIDVTFKLGTDVELATVQTQNKVSLATPLLPPEVQRVGVTVKKVSSALLMVVGLSAPDGRYDSLFLNNFATINLVDRIRSLTGVGDVRLGASQNYAMRIWVNPDRLAPSSCSTSQRRKLPPRGARLSRLRMPSAGCLAEIRRPLLVGPRSTPIGSPRMCPRDCRRRFSSIAQTCGRLS